MSDDPIRSRMQALLKSIAFWRAAHLAGSEDEDVARRVVLDAFGYLGEAIDAEPRREPEPAPTYRSEPLANGRAELIYRDGMELGTITLEDAEWLSEDPVNVTFRLPLTPEGQP